MYLYPTLTTSSFLMFCVGKSEVHQRRHNSSFRKAMVPPKKTCLPLRLPPPINTLQPPPRHQQTRPTAPTQTPLRAPRTLRKPSSNGRLRPLPPLGRRPKLHHTLRLYHSQHHLLHRPHLIRPPRHHPPPKTAQHPRTRTPCTRNLQHLRSIRHRIPLLIQR